jgi:salicylate hydroxylase
MKMIDPGIYEGFLRCATNNAWPSHEKFWFCFRKGQDPGSKYGTTFYDMTCETGQMSVHRASYLDELVALVPKEISHFGKQLRNAEDKGDHVILHFADGTTAKHSAVIGCDGVKSVTRGVVLGKDHPAVKATFSGKYAYRGLIPMDEAAALMGDELARNSQMYFGQGGHILTFPIEKGKTMNVVAFSTKQDGKWDDPEWVKPMNRDAMFKDFEGWTEATQHILSMMQKPDIWALFDVPPAPTYYNGRICLLGDAAHASTPHNGAGAGQAIEDALCISRVMRLVYDGADIPRAFAAFDKVRRPRSQKQVQLARDSGWLYDLQLPGYIDDWDKIKDMLQWKQDWIWNVDLEAHVKEAERTFNEETSNL